MVGAVVVVAGFMAGVEVRWLHAGRTAATVRDKRITDFFKA